MERRGKSPTPAISEAGSSVPFYTRSFEETLSDYGSRRGHRVRGGGRRRVMHAATRGSRFRARREYARLCAGTGKGPLPALGGTVSVREVMGVPTIPATGPSIVPDSPAPPSSSSDSWYHPPPKQVRKPIWSGGCGHRKAPPSLDQKDSPAFPQRAWT
jgi:hypothetical protein